MQSISEKQPKKTKGRKLPKFLYPEDVEKLLSPLNIKCLTGLRNRVIFETMFRAGLRVSEVCDLAPGHIDFNNGLISVQQGKGNKDRIVPIGDILLEWLKKWDEKRIQDSPYFFSTLKGGRLDRTQLHVTLARLSNKSKIFIQNGTEKKPVNCQVLRHSYATYYMGMGISLRELQELLGHSNVQTTEIYTHVTLRALSDKIKALG